MEVKKSYKADLEHRRPMFFVASLVGVTLFFIAVLFIPYKSIGELLDEAFDDYTMDLDLKQEKDDMISAALPQQKEEPKIAEKLNKVEEAAEPVMEELTPAPKEEKHEDVEETKEEPPINLNEDDEEVMKVVEELPQYPGGMVEFMKWLTATLKYPEQALKRKIEGKVIVSFIVNKDGTLSDIKLTKRVNKLLDDEALRVARMMPNWKPGIDKGKPCRSMIAIPIVFEI
ncbi:MAG: energy transducer TonB [Prevotella sp.]|nr:energy transducer TonB [Prevotella sp.]MBR1839777.1 energy transducer TonB [Prevotella sp.]